MKYLPLVKVAKQLGLSVDDLCHLILTERTPIYADSDYVRQVGSDDPCFYEVKIQSIEEVLAADKIIYTVEFKYPREIKKLRLKASEYDLQKISRNSLYIDQSQILQLKKLKSKDKSLKKPLIKNKNTRIKSSAGTGSHWDATREKLLSAANLELRANFHKYKKPNGKVNYSDLAEFLDKNRSGWGSSPDKNKRALQPKLIAEWLSKFDKQSRLYNPKIDPK